MLWLVTLLLVSLQPTKDVNDEHDLLKAKVKIVVVVEVANLQSDHCATMILLAIVVYTCDAYL